jgi:hypothetical protein
MCKFTVCNNRSTLQPTKPKLLSAKQHIMVFWLWQENYVATPKKKAYLFFAFVLCLFAPFFVPVYMLMIEKSPCCYGRYITSLGIQCITWTFILFFTTCLLWIPGVLLAFRYMKLNMDAVHMYFNEGIMT